MSADTSIDSTNSATAPAEHSPWAAAATGTLPAGVDFQMLDINLEDYLKSPEARVRFFPDGTCDEMTLVLHSAGNWRMITLEFATSLATAKEVTQ